MYDSERTYTVAQNLPQGITLNYYFLKHFDDIIDKMHMMHVEKNAPQFLVDTQNLFLKLTKDNDKFFERKIEEKKCVGADCKERPHTTDVHKDT